MSTWFNIALLTNGGTKSAKVKIHDEIGGWGVNARSFFRQLEDLGPVDALDIEINSPGGSVLDGWAMYNGIQLHPAAKKSTTVIGLAASMASVLMLATDDRRIAKNAHVMVHRVTGGSQGTHEEMAKAADMTKQMEDQIVKAYVERTGQKEPAIREMMNSLTGTWLDGDEAVQKGFATAVLAPNKAINFSRAWARHFASLPSALIDTLTLTSPAPTIIPNPPMKLTAAQKKAAALAARDEALLTALQGRKEAQTALETAAKAVSDAGAAVTDAQKTAVTEAQKALDLASKAAKKAKKAADDDDEDDDDEEEEESGNKALLARIAALEQGIQDKAAADAKAKSEADAKTENQKLLDRLATLEAAAKSGIIKAAGSGTTTDGAGKGAETKEKKLEDLSPRELIALGNKKGNETYAKLRDNLQAQAQN